MGDGLLTIMDQRGAISHLESFLAVPLDACARELGLDWGRYVTFVR
jgi:hypothetical protein